MNTGMEREWIPYVATEVSAPGETLRETLEALPMTQAQLALRTGLSGKHINQIVRGLAPVTHETAIAFERATGVPASLWNSLESRYRDHLTRLGEEKELDAQTGWLTSMPLKALRQRGVVTATWREPGKQLQQILQFFGVTGVEAWDAAWAQPSANFLQSSAFTAEAGAVAAWLRLGELAAAEVETVPFDKARLREILPELRSLTTETPDVFWPRVVELCASAGVALVIVEEVPGARASGATRWISPTKALVQLSNRGKRNDLFWFALFHELGHVLLHGKKEVFVESSLGHDGGRAEQEEGANEFAGQTLIPSAFESDLLKIETPADARVLAARLGIAPAIVGGRIAHDREEFTFGKPGLYEKFAVRYADAAGDQESSY